jgi:hypothetical protein
MLACVLLVGFQAPAHGSSPETVSDPLNNAGGRVVVAGDETGNAVAVFLQAEEGELRVAVVRRPAGGGWSQLHFLSPPGTGTATPTVAMDDKGRAVAVWQWNDTRGIARIQGASMSADGSWSEPEILSPPTVHAQVPDLAVSGDGAATVVWRTSVASGTGPETVHARHRPAGGDWGGDVMLAGDARNPHVAADAQGNAVAAWTRTGEVVESASLPAGGSWSSSTIISDPQLPSYLVDLDMNRAGMAVAGWFDVGEDRVGVTSKAPNGSWEAPVVLSAPAGIDPRPAIAVGDNGGAVAVWHRGGQQGGEVEAVLASHRAPDGTWEDPQVISATFSSALFPSVSMDRAGNALAGFRQWANMSWIPSLVRRPADGTWGEPMFPAAAGEGATYEVFPFHDGVGNEVVAWHRKTDTVDNPIEQVRILGIDRAGPVSSLTLPGAARLTSTAFPVSWSAVDAWGEVASTELRYREAAYSSDMGDWTEWDAETAAGVAPYSGKPGYTYCFAARATDDWGREGAWSTERCTATPVDDRSLKGQGEWSRTTPRGTYRGTETTSRRRGDALVLHGVRATRLALVVTRMPGAGNVRVALNGEPLGTFRLRAAQVRKRALVEVARFSSLREGRLTIRVVSRTGRPVRIDGVVVAQS